MLKFLLRGPMATSCGFVLAMFSLGGCGVLTLNHASEQRPAPSGLALTYPPGSIKSESVADRALADVAVQREETEQQFRSANVACFHQFFVTSCTDKARDQRRVALAEIRGVEVEADYTKRRLRAEERDKAIAARAVQEAAEAPQREQQAAAFEKTAAEKEARRSKLESTTSAPPAPAATEGGQRQATHDRRQAKRRAEEAAAVPERAAKRAAFQKKQIDAQEREKQRAADKAAKTAQSAASAPAAAAPK